jgi:hypothetical protein
MWAGFKSLSQGRNAPNAHAPAYDVRRNWRRPTWHRPLGCALTAWWSLDILVSLSNNALSTAQVSTVEWQDASRCSYGGIVEGHGHQADVWYQSSKCLAETNEIAWNINLDECEVGSPTAILSDSLTLSSCRSPRIYRRGSNCHIYFKCVKCCNSNTATVQVFQAWLTLETYQCMIPKTCTSKTCNRSMYVSPASYVGRWN